MNQIAHKAQVDVYIHELSNRTNTHFGMIINEKMDTYDFIGIMLQANHLNEDILKIINGIPKQKLLILDKRNEFIRGNYACVYQDFAQDIYEALQKAKALVLKYKTINFIIKERYFYSLAITEGITKFALENHLNYHVYTQVHEEMIREKEAYLILSERFLAETLKVCGVKNMRIGEDIGIVSYHETPLKQVLSGGITVVSTDHFELGKNAANLILSGKQEHIRNPFLFIQRNSL
jgi:DNA-binding LacI/PurR family transcriptional regulator